MLCASTIMLETKFKYNYAITFLLMQSNVAASFKTSVSCHISSACIYSFNNQTTTLWNSSNTTDNAVLQCLCLSFLVPAPLNLLRFFFQI